MDHTQKELKKAALQDAITRVRLAHRDYARTFVALWPRPPKIQHKVQALTYFLAIGISDTEGTLTFLCKKKSLSYQMWEDKLHVYCTNPRKVARVCSRLDCFAEWVEARRYGAMAATAKVLEDQKYYTQLLETRLAGMELEQASQQELNDRFKQAVGGL